VKFTLTFEGRLPSSGNKAKNGAKWDIRNRLHPQLKDLWENNAALRDIELNRIWPKGGNMLFHAHHSEPPPPPLKQMVGDHSLDLCASIDKFGVWFKPIVRESFALHCGLKIMFLRKEIPGKLYQAGDLDGRMKTIIDSLTMPRHVEQMSNVCLITTPEVPIFCLMEDDSLVSGLNIESEKLLDGGEYPEDYVKLTIEVDVRIRHATMYNQSFL
jgi:hypothetical protein